MFVITYYIYTKVNDFAIGDGYVLLRQCIATFGRAFDDYIY